MELIESQTNSSKIENNNIPQEEEIKLQLVWILDITNSMTKQIKACKKAVQLTAEQVQGKRMPISFTIITYTENKNGSYVSYDQFDSAIEAVEFVNTIQLNKPPHHPAVTADGGDKDENFKHALALLKKEHNFEIPSITFLLTDAGYHSMKRPLSREGKAELLALAQIGVKNPSAYDIWEEIDKKKFFFFPLLFAKMRDLMTYLIFAKDTGSLAFNAPEKISSEKISICMMTMIQIILDTLNEEELGEIPPIPEFELFDLNNINDELREEVLGITEKDKFKMVAKEDKNLRIRSTILRICKIIGKKWKKRHISMDLVSFKYQMMFVPLAMKYIMSEDEDLEKELILCIQRIYQYTDREQKNQVNLSIEAIQDIKEMFQNSRVKDEEFDLITRETVEEVGNELTVEQIRREFVDTACSLLYGLPINMKFMQDHTGQTDFASAWEAVINYIGLDTQSLKTSIDQIWKSTQYCEYNEDVRGLQDQTVTTNSFLILSGKRGSLRWAVFKIASHTQILNSAMSLGVGGTLTQFVPHMHAGIAMQAFMYLCNEDLSTYNFIRMLDILNTVRDITSCPKGSILEAFDEGHSTPDASISKLIYVWLKIVKSDNILLDIVREIMGFFIQRHFGKNTLENDATYEKYLREFFDFKEIFGDFSKDVMKLHPLEDMSLEYKYLKRYIRKGKSKRGNYYKDIGESLIRYLNSEKLKEKVYSNHIFQKFRSYTSKLWTVLKSDLDIYEKPEFLEDIIKIYPECHHDFIEALILRKRKARYELVETIGEKRFILKKLEPLPIMLLKMLRDVYKNSDEMRMRDFNTRKFMENKIRNTLLHATNLNKTKLGWTNFLNNLTIKFNMKNYFFERADMVKEKKVLMNQNLLSTIITTEWGMEPMSVLTNKIEDIKQSIKNIYPMNVIDNIVKIRHKKIAGVCNRDPKLPNRHGHHLELQFPGIFNWTQDYHDRRIKFRDQKWGKFLNRMRVITQTMELFSDIDGIEEGHVRYYGNLYAHHPGGLGKIRKALAADFPQKSEKINKINVF